MEPIEEQAAPEPILQEFRFTFGLKYRTEPHPTGFPADPDGWVSVIAYSWNAARAIAFRHLGDAWAFQYVGPDWEKNGFPHSYPKGELAQWTA